MTRPALRRSLILSTALGASLGVFATPAAAQTYGAFGKVDGVSTSGGAALNPQIALGTTNAANDTLNVKLNARNTLIDWDTFNVTANHIANFTDNRFVGGTAMAVLNRVANGQTTLGGAINAASNIQLWIVNGNGIVIGPGANINTGGLVLSTLPMTSSDANFLNSNGTTGSYAVRFAGTGGPITGIAGLPATITTTGGVLAMVAPQINTSPNLSTNSGANQTAFVLATDVNFSTQPGGPLSITINAGTALNSSIQGTVVGDRVYAMLKPQNGIDALLSMPASVSNATVGADGVVVLSGGGLTASVGTGGNRDALSTGAANSAATNPSLSVGPITFATPRGTTPTAPTAGSITLLSANGDVAAGNLSAAGDITVGYAGNGAVGATHTALVTGAVAAGGDYTVSGGGIGLSLPGSTATQTAGGTVTLTSGVLNTGGDLTVTGAGGIAISGLIGNLNGDTGSLTLTSGTAGGVQVGASSRSGALVIDAGTGGAVFGALSGSGAKTVASGGVITGTAGIDGAGAVNLSSTSNSAAIGIAGGIGGSTQVGSLVVNGGGAVTIGTANGTPVGINATGAITIGGTTAPGSLQVNGAVGAQSLSSRVTGNTTLSGVGVAADLSIAGTAATSTITFTGAVDGAGALRTSAAGQTRFGAPIGGTTAFSSVTTGAGAAIVAGSVTTTGSQSFAGGLSLGSDTVLTTGASGQFNFGTGLAGANHNLTLNGGGTTAVGGALTGLHDLIVNSTSGGNTIINGNVVTSGSQTYRNAVALGADATLSSTGSTGLRQISFESTLDGAHTLTVTTSGGLRLASDVGLVTPLTGINAANVATQIAGAVRTNGDQRFGAATLSGTGIASIDANAGAVTFASVSGPRGLDVVTTGAVALGIAGNNVNPLASLRVNNAASLTASSVTASGAVELGRGGAIGSIGITGTVSAASLASTTATTTAIGQIATTTGGIQVNGQGDVTFASSVAANGAGAAIAIDAGVGGITGTTFAANGALTLVGAGTATVTGNVLAGGDYRVTGGQVTLGDPGGAIVTQQAGGLLEISTVGGAGTAGQITGRAGLILIGRGTGPALVIGGAGTGAIAFAPGSTLNAGDGELRFNTANDTDAFQLGNVVAGTLSQTVGGGGIAQGLSRTGAITAGALSLSGAATTIRSGGQLTVGAVTLTQGTGGAGARALSLTGDAGVTTGRLANAAGVIGTVMVAGDGTPGGTASVAGADLAGTLTVRAGTGGVTIGSLTGAGDKLIRSGAGIDGTGATITGGAVSLAAGAGAPLTIGAVGTAAAPLLSLTIDGGGDVTLGSGVVTGDTMVGGGAATGSLLLNGPYQSGARFTSQTTGRTALGSLTSAGALSATAGTVASGDALTFGDLRGVGSKTLTASGSINGASVGGAGDVAITPATGGDVTLSGGIGTAGGSVGQLTVARGGTVQIGGGIAAAGMATFGQATSPLAALTVGGATTVGGGFGVVATNAVQLGAVTATNAIAVGSSGGAVTTGALNGSSVGVNAGGAATVGGGGSGSDFAITAGGQAGISGNVTATGNYLVSGSGVALGAGGLQQAGGAVTLVANGGDITGSTGLRLVSGSGDVTLGGATTNAVQLGGTTIGAGGLTAPTATHAVTVRTATGGTALVLGDVLADALGQQLGTDPATPGSLVRAGDVTTGNLVLGTAGGATTLASSAGALSVGSLLAGNTVVLGAAGGTGTVVNGAIGALNGAAASVQVSGQSVRIGDSALSGALALTAGGGGLTFGRLTGAGSKTLTSGAGLTGTTIDGGAVALRAGNAPLTISGAIGVGSAVASLAIDGGSQATFGTAGATPVAINATGAVVIGAATPPGSLQINGAVRTSNFVVRSGSDINFGDLASDNAITLSSSGNVGFGTLSGAGDKTVTAGGTLTGGNVFGAGAVSLTSGAGQDLTITGRIGMPGAAVGSLTVNGGGAVRIGSDPAVQAIAVAGDLLIGQSSPPASVTVNGASVAGGAAAIRAAGLIDLDQLSAGTTLTLDSTGGGISFDRLTAPGATRVNAATALTGNAVDGGGALVLSAGGADALGVGTIGATAAAASLTVSGGRSVTLGAGTPVRVVGATRIGQVADGAATGALVVNGALQTGSLVASTTGATQLGAVTAISGIGVNAGGNATVSGAVTAGGDYRVRGATVSLGNAAVTQAAAGLVDVVATSGAVTGAAGLVLQANSDGTGGEYLAIDAANGLNLGGTTLLGGTTAGLSDIGVTNAGGAFTLGTVTGRALGSFDAGRATLGAITTPGDITALAPITLQRALGLTSTGGAITLGSVAVTDPGAGIALATTGPGGGAISAQSLVAPGAISIDARGTVTVTGASGGSGVFRGTAVTLGTLGFSNGLAVTTTGGALALGTATAGATTLDAVGDVLVSNSLLAGGPVSITATGNAALAQVGTTAGALSVQAGGSVAGVNGGRAALAATGTGGDLNVRAGTSALLGPLVASDAGGTASITAATALDVSSLVAGGAVTTTSGAGTVLNTVRSKGGAVDVTGQTVAVTTADAGSTLLLRSTGGALTLGSGTAGGGATLTSASDVSVGTRLSAGGPTQITATGNAQLASIGTTAGALSVEAGGSIGGLAGARADLAATGAGGNLSVRAGTGALLGTATASDAGGALTATAGTTLDATALVAGGAITTASTGATMIGTAQSKGGAIGATGATLAVGSADASGALVLRSTTGALTLNSGKAGGAATLTSATTLTAGPLNATGAATLSSGGAATLGQLAGSALTVTTGGDLSLAGGQTGGTASFDVTGTANLGAVNAGTTITTKAADVQLTGAQRAATVTFTNRAPTTATVKLGNGLSGAGFSLSTDEVNLVDAGQLVIDAGAGNVEVGALALNATAGKNRVDVLSTGRIDVLAALTGSGAGRTVRLGGTLANTTDKAGVIRVVATSSGGGRLLLDTADLDLRGSRIGVGLATSFLDAIGFDSATGQSPAAVNAAYVGNPNSSLYNSTFSGAIYTSPNLITARSLTVRYTDYALFQNTAAAGQSGGVALGAAGAPLANSLVIDGPGTGTSGFALFGSIGGIGGTPAAVLGPSVISVNAGDLANTRVNGCLVGSGAGCLTSVVVQPTLNVFDNSRANVFRAADDLTVPFDPLLGTNNEALFSGVGLLDPTANATGCAADTTSPNCGQQGEPGK